MSRSIFDDPELDEPKHCNNKKTWCDPDPVFHVVGEPLLGILMPHPDSLHVRVEPAACGCRCLDCVAVNELRAQREKSAIQRAYEAYKSGKPIFDPRCTICSIRARMKAAAQGGVPCGPKRTSKKPRTS